MKILKAGCVILSQQKPIKIALVYRKKQQDFSFPKGHLEMGEDLTACAVREAKEETGLDVKILKKLPSLSYSTPKESNVEVVFFLAKAIQDNADISEDCSELKWINIGEIKKVLSYHNLKKYWDEICPIINRCSWVNMDNPAYIAYHDDEWGVPVHDDTLLFEMLVLESFVAGLSWECVLNKREEFRKAFDNFDVKKVAKYDEAKVAELLGNVGIIRHRAKIESAINNAATFMKVQQEFGSFDAYLWQWVDGKPIVGDGSWVARTPLSDAVAKDLKRRGFKFMGSTTVYAYLQAVGVVNDHAPECFCR